MAGLAPLPDGLPVPPPNRDGQRHNACWPPHLGHGGCLLPEGHGSWQRPLTYSLHSRSWDSAPELLELLGRQPELSGKYE